jgi:hypothetical protein
MAKKNIAASEPAVDGEPVPIVHKTLGHAMLGVMNEVAYVQKRKAAGLNYTFASEADIVGLMHEAFTRHGLVMWPIDQVEVKFETYVTSKDTSMNRTTLKAVYLIEHPDSGQTRELKMFGEGADVGDKSVAKAMTMAYKYLIRQSGMLETGNDPDFTPSAEQERKQAGKGRTDDGKANGKPVSLTELFSVALNSIANAPDLVKLDLYLKTAGERGFDTMQMKVLTEAGAKRRQELTPKQESKPTSRPPSATAGQPPQSAPSPDSDDSDDGNQEEEDEF